MSSAFFYSMGLVVLGGELAVPYTRNPLYAGLNPPRRVFPSRSETILTGRHATGGREPRQVRKEAAISDSGCVVDRSRSCLWFLLPKGNSTGGAQPIPTSVSFFIRPKYGIPLCRFSQYQESLSLTSKQMDLFFWATSALEGVSAAFFGFLNK
jgi:hypothetical protein